FYAVGLPTPGAIGRKREILMPSRPGERLVIVVADVVRCSSTLLACFGAGLQSATIGVKSGGGTSRQQADLIGAALGAEVIGGGEVNGQPIPGGLIGNSPVQASRIAWKGKHLHFKSTNFGAAFARVHELAREIRRRGGQVDVIVGSLANCAAIVRRIVSRHYDRVFVATGGFYESASEEDMIFGGDVFTGLGCVADDMDDEARLMLFAAQALPGTEARRAHLHTNWIGRALDRFGMADDIDAIVTGRGLSRDIQRAMATIILEVVTAMGEPVITTSPLTLSIPLAAPIAVRANNNPKGEYAYGE
ncbi:MAG: 2-phosphosulfolactate phosphatase, partial [Terracidiphilus sp.]